MNNHLFPITYDITYKLYKWPAAVIAAESISNLPKMGRNGAEFFFWNSLAKGKTCNGLLY
jgi:hypothetical protein